MSSRWIMKLAIPVTGLSIAACSDGIGPGGSRDFLDLSLDFCASEAPVFLAFQNENGPWERVLPDGNQTFRFVAADRMALAMIFQFGTTYVTEIVYAQNDELLPLSGGACTETSGAKSLNGSVASVPPGSFANVSMALTTETFDSPQSTFTLTSLPNGQLDIVANRGSLQLTGEVPDRVIIRRSEDRISGSTIPVLDFASSEAANVTSNALTVNGLVAGEDNLIDLFFETATTFAHPLFLSSLFTSSNQTIYHVPGTLTQAGDLHVLDVYAETSNGLAYRGETQFYRNAGSKVITLGAALNTPTISTVSSTPSARLRMQMGAQSDYPSFVLALYGQGARRVSVLGTAAYVGSPVTWDLVMPDLSGVSGFPTQSVLQSGVQTSTQVIGYAGDVATFFGATAENTSLRYAARLSSQTALRALRAGGAGDDALLERRSRPTPALARRNMTTR